MNEDQTGSDSGKLHMSLAGPNPEHMDDEFLVTAYPKVHENPKLITDEHVIDDKPEKPVISSGPEPLIVTPGQLKSRLAPTDKELEMLFQPMFDEHFEQTRVNKPVPSAIEINAQVVPPVQHQEIAEEPIQEDPPIIHDVLHPSHN
ncbi:hypothetical protein Tco_0310646, partial [Tanacetum coccineum]